jgi:hypothetical protein
VSYGQAVVNDITGGIRHVKEFCVTQEYSNGGSHETLMLSEDSTQGRVRTYMYLVNLA